MPNNFVSVNPEYSIGAQPGIQDGGSQVTATNTDGGNDLTIASVGGTFASCNTGLCDPALSAQIQTGCWQSYCDGDILPIPVSDLANWGTTATATFDNDPSGNSPPAVGTGTFDDELNFWFSPNPGPRNAMQNDSVNMLISLGGEVLGKRSLQAGGCEPPSRPPGQSGPTDPKNTIYQTGVAIQGQTFTVCGYHAGGGTYAYILVFVLQSNVEAESLNVNDFYKWANTAGYLPSNFYLNDVSAFHETWNAVPANKLTISNFSVTNNSSAPTHTVQLSTRAPNGALYWFNTNGSATIYSGVGLLGGTSSSEARCGGSFISAVQLSNTNLQTLAPDCGSTYWGLGMAPNSTPSIAQTGWGSWVTAFQVNTTDLWTMNQTGQTNNFGLGMDANTSPAITYVDGGAEVAMQGNNNVLYTVGTDGNETWSADPAMAPGTSPSIAWLPGGYEVAYRGSNGNLTLVGSGADAVNEQYSLGMAPGTSPGITSTPDGYEVVFQTNTGDTWALSSANSIADYQTGLEAGSSPSITYIPGGYEIGAPVNTADLWAIGTGGTYDFHAIIDAGVQPGAGADARRAGQSPQSTYRVRRIKVRTWQAHVPTTALLGRPQPLHVQVRHGRVIGRRVKVAWHKVVLKRM